MIYQKKFKYITLGTLLLLCSFSIPSVHAKSKILPKNQLINYTKNVHIRHHHRHKVKKRQHHFAYSKQTLRYVHHYFMKHFQVDFNPYTVRMLTKYSTGFENPSKHVLKQRLNHLLYKYTVHYKYYWSKQHHHYVRKGYFKMDMNRPDLTSYQYHQELKQASNQGSSFNNAMRNQLLSDINRTRQSFHVAPLQLNLTMQQLADYRNQYTQQAYEYANPTKIKQIEHISQKQLNSDDGMTDDWGHGYDNHTDGTRYLRNHHIFYRYWGANNGNWFYGNDSRNHQPDGDNDKYSDYTPQGIADNIDDEEINHDNVWNMHNGHRKNELDPNYKYIGVGINYDKSHNYGTFNEQFGA